jgi:hypothetical protein
MKSSFYFYFPKEEGSFFVANRASNTYANTHAPDVGHHVLCLDALLAKESRQCTGTGSFDVVKLSQAAFTVVVGQSPSIRVDVGGTPTLTELRPSNSKHRIDGTIHPQQLAIEDCALPVMMLLLLVVLGRVHGIPLLLFAIIKRKNRSSCAWKIISRTASDAAN